MMLDLDLQLERALARISEPRVAVIAVDPSAGSRFPQRWRVQRCAGLPGLAAAGGVDLVVIDARFVDRYGPIEECRDLTSAPVVVMIEDTDPASRYLELGADACVERAATAQEWDARFQALIRPIETPAPAGDDRVFRHGDLSVSIERRSVARGGEPIDLTPREFEVLHELLNAAPASVPGEQIAGSLWGSTTTAAMTRVRVYVARLRRKLERDPSTPSVIVTEGGAYRTTLQRPREARRGTSVMLLGHDEVTAERLRREFAHGEIKTSIQCSASPTAACDGFDAILTPADPVAISRLRMALGDQHAPLIAVGPALDTAATISVLAAGARDVAPYPGQPGELPARVAALVRRGRAPGTNPAASLRTGALEIDLCQPRVESGGEPVAMSPTEYRLLATLARRVDQVMSHQELLTEVWGPEYREETHYIRVYVRSLRAKIEDDPADPRYLVSEWGRGYRLAALPVLEGAQKLLEVAQGSPRGRTA